MNHPDFLSKKNISDNILEHEKDENAEKTMKVWFLRYSFSQNSWNWPYKQALILRNCLFLSAFW
jgi:hypothetical protein